jgi:hypothetical protein
MRRLSPAKFFLSLVLSVIGAALGSSPAYTAQEATDVAFVENVSGRVVAISQGKPTLLQTFDTINDRTQLDILANSELLICHYQTHQVLTLKGPLRATISRDGVTVENRNVVLASTGSCSAAVASTFQGGVLSRGVPDQSPVNDAPGVR